MFCYCSGWWRQRQQSQWYGQLWRRWKQEWRKWYSLKCSYQEYIPWVDTKQPRFWRSSLCKVSYKSFIKWNSSWYQVLTWKQEWSLWQSTQFSSIKNIASFLKPTSNRSAWGQLSSLYKFTYCIGSVCEHMYRVKICACTRIYSTR